MGGGRKAPVGDLNSAERPKTSLSETPGPAASLADANIADIRRLSRTGSGTEYFSAVPMAEPVDYALLTRKEVGPEDWKFLPKVDPNALAPKAVDGKEENGYTYHPANPPGLDARPGAEYDGYHKKEHRKVDTSEDDYVGYEGNIFQGTYGVAGATEVEFKFEAGEKADKDGNVTDRVVTYTAADGSAQGPNLKLAGANDDIGKNVHQISWQQEPGSATSSVFVERYPEPIAGTKGETKTWVANADVAEDGSIGSYAWESWKKAADGTKISHTVLDRKTSQPIREEFFDDKGEKVVRIVNNWYSEDGKSRVEWVTDETDRTGKKADEPGRLISKSDFVDGHPVRERKYDKTEVNKAAGKDEVTLVTLNYDAAGLVQYETKYRPSTQAEAEKQHKATGELLPREVRKDIAKKGGYSLTRYDVHDKVTPPIEYYDKNNKRLDNDIVKKGSEAVRKRQSSP